MAEMTVTVVTPEETVVETTASSVVLPLYDGEVGILRGHAPMIGRLGYGEMRLTVDGKTDSFYVDGGFVQVADNVVNVMTNRAMEVGEIDFVSANEHLEQSLGLTAKGDEGILTRLRSIEQARAQLRLAKKAR
ncbi:ATP synthase epsilon chain, sodium ion specific [Botrimarina colliarenosi]|uniref:ATP synthase epsilon chain n=1 Tax=Botrimarina colliarenosi TaxID=2528001 RepID=A0A5C6A0T8_9BACT|nr:ATP synthase F1 subunit epsilon [Botrimarina colliarenosi]TWT93444.1 ATP synthase epsilon chain, sodium ion specific [Botrimarina colliarenosi]